MSLSDEDVDKIVEKVVSRLRDNPGRPLNSRDLWEKGRASRFAAKDAESDFLLEFFRDQMVGIFGYFIKWGRGVKEGIAVIANTQADFMMSARSFGRPKIPTNMLAIVAVGIALIAMFTVNPELLQGVGLFVSANQFIVIFIALIVLIGLYLWVRRRRK